MNGMFNANAQVMPAQVMGAYPSGYYPTQTSGFDFSAVMGMFMPIMMVSMVFWMVGGLMVIKRKRGVSSGVFWIIDTGQIYKSYF